MRSSSLHSTFCALHLTTRFSDEIADDDISAYAEMLPACLGNVGDIPPAGLTDGDNLLQILLAYDTVKYYAM